jgi:acetylornithine/succinyldiaminopimelate/putrescine aminotransferase
MGQRHSLLESFDRLEREQIPNLVRLYLNPYVAQTCLCLSHYVQSTWAINDECQSFLANGFDEALSGAIKLARNFLNLAARPTTGLVFDPSNRLGSFASTVIAGGTKVEFLPGLEVIGSDSKADEFGAAIGHLVLIAVENAALDEHADSIRQITWRDAPLVIVCVDRRGLALLRRSSPTWLRDITPDIVVFDESFVDHAVPFSAFTARKSLYDIWNRPGKTTFHSTTYQPNTISSLHFMRCLTEADPEFHASLAGELETIGSDIQVRWEMYKRLYSPSLARMIRTTGFDAADVYAQGNYVSVGRQRIFDAVSGVACSVRGHNPVGYTEEIAALGRISDCQDEVEARLRDLTGLHYVLPAVSGATAVENALKIALVAQYPKRHVLALKSGFGGKTLLALTGTANPSYKRQIDPLYPHISYVDPFAPDAEAQIEAVLEAVPVAVVQVELIQAVGGVRRVPEKVIRYLESRRQHWNYLLLVDEIQTGMHRTGSFTLAHDIGIAPDLLVLGKAASDMMFPFALTLFLAEVQKKLDQAGSELPAAIRKRYDYEFGYKTVLNVLRHADSLSLAQRVTASGELFARHLREGLADCPAVREVRVYGLLIGIELEASRWPQRWFGKRLFSLYVYAMLRHPQYPVLVGFCQYEPNVLKITPPLTIAPDDVREVCATIVDVLRKPFHRLLATVAGGLVNSFRLRRRKYERIHNHVESAAHEHVAGRFLRPL